MNFSAVFHLISYPIMLIGAGMAAAWGVSFYKHDPPKAQLALAICSLVTLATGLIMRIFTKCQEEDIRRREGFGVVTFGWLMASLFGALPFIFSGAIPHPVDAVFETMSGLTTTGASVMSQLETVPRGILMWRAITHFFGGMGVLVLCIAILPILGGGGMQVFQAEMPGPIKDRLTPRIESTARLLWSIYALLVVAETVLLRFSGMSWFDAVCHSFATVATGGFSTRTESIQYFNSAYIETVIIVFMFLAGINFALHYRVLTGQPMAYFRSPELRFYFFLWLGAGCLATAAIWHHHLAHGFEALRIGFFHVTSILTTTGFTTRDFDQWPDGAKLLLVLLMLIGGCAGSTGGGMKVIRIMVALKAAWREIRLFVQPQAVFRIKVGQENLEEEAVSNIVGFVLIYLLIFAGGTMLMCLFTPNLQTALSATAATLGNIGPGLGAVGPTETYAAISPTGKLLLVFFMLLGRLELYTVLVLLLPSTWKK